MALSKSQAIPSAVNLHHRRRCARQCTSRAWSRKSIYQNSANGSQKRYRSEVARRYRHRHGAVSESKGNNDAPHTSSVAIGELANVYGASGTALGSHTTIGTADKRVDNGVAIGDQSQVLANNSIAIGTQS